MSDRLLKESDVLRIAFQLPFVVSSAFVNAVKALPSADNEVIGKLKTAIENEEICKNCPTAERITSENLLGAMALGFGYGMEADRPQGEWIVNISDYKSVCSVCGANEMHFIYGTEMWYGLGKSHFCPYCGARMKGGKP